MFSRKRRFAFPVVEFALASAGAAFAVVVRNLAENVGSFAVARTLVGALHELMRPVTLFLLNTGCPEGEVLACEWDWIDLDAGLIRCEPQRRLAAKRRRSPRNPNQLRTPAVAPRRALRLRQPPNQRPLAKLAAPPLGERQYQSRVSGKPIGGSPHVCRHTFASLFLATQADLFLLAHLLGHSHTRVTQLYSHLLPRHLERARNAVNLAAPIGAAEWRAELRWR